MKIPKGRVGGNAEDALRQRNINGTTKSNGNKLRMKFRQNSRISNKTILLERLARSYPFLSTGNGTGAHATGDFSDMSVSWI